MHHPRLSLSIFALFSLSFSAFAQAAPACPVAPEKLKDLDNAQVATHCVQRLRALPIPRIHPPDPRDLFQCDESLWMAKEAANVVHALKGRKNSFNPVLPDAVTQDEARIKALQLLSGAHAYANIGMASAYRGGIKIRKVLADGKRALARVDSRIVQVKAQLADQEARVARLETEGKAAEAKIVREQVLPQYQQAIRAAEGARRIVEDAHACMDIVVKPNADSFEEWKDTKAKLLETSFLKYAAVMENPAHTQILRGMLEKFQREQQYVYDVLTNPEKRDWAYLLAEGCETNNCRGWSSAVSAGGYATRLFGLASKTPVLGAIAGVVSAGLSADLAMRQGLSTWQQVLEFVNAWNPIRPLHFDTEIIEIEKGRVRPYSPPRA